MLGEVEFEEALRLAALREKEETIGELAEKTLHCVLKYFFCADSSCHEVKLNGYVADILEEQDNGEQLITEIQTRQVFRLSRKLAAYGRQAQVRIVLPVVCNKRIVIKDSVTGEVVSSRMSPQHQSIYHAVKELYGIREYIGHDNIMVYAVLINAIEYKLYASATAGKRLKYERADIVPTEMLSMCVLKDKSAYAKLVPFEENVSFTAGELAKIEKIPLQTARQALLVLKTVGVVEECGKQGRKKLWKLK